MLVIVHMNTITIITYQDAAMILEETPGQVTQALRLFLQGQGYCLNIRKNPL